jgi:hypothetical protein
MELEQMGQNESGKKVTATVGDRDHEVIRRICDARGISISQWLQETIAESLYKAIASGYLHKIEDFHKNRKPTHKSRSESKEVPNGDN